uniref:NADH-ubiquinone oxidoreductase chain 2 n=1 Tax=Metacrangonyx spinicaudatus TaxID=1199190 RepID=K7ZWK0_9CRUS|nr:NADH dehydrogenase subunit 2 [Metacrangonyx spinicaudatus]CCI69420.1 NADH dehydrogenase subunit 2 [Metacrangonyx spinicaudatus]
MFFHPSTILFVFFLFFSLIMSICMNSWFLIWFFIEMNLLSFIPLILLKKNKYSVESSLKYFFIQTLSSILILIALILLFTKFDMYNILFISGLSIKLGLAPFHQWMVNIVEGLVWPLMGVLLTIQKVGPFILFCYIYNIKDNLIYLMYLISLLCSFFGCLGGLFTNSLRKILVFSSISHASWMILALMSSISLWSLYFSLYMMILFSVLYILNSFYLTNLNHMFLKLNFFISFSLGISLLSLGGMPPLTGFVPKFIMMKELLMNYNFFILLFLLLGVFISLFFYSRLFMFNFIFLSYKNLFLKYSKSKINYILYINMMGFVMIPLIMYMY